MVYSVVKIVVFLAAVKTLANRLREDVSVMPVKNYVLKYNTRTTFK